MPLIEPYFKKYASGKCLFEIGCACGIYGIEALKSAKSYIGIDKSSKMCNNAYVTIRSMEPREMASVYNIGVGDWEVLRLLPKGESICLFDMVTLYSYSDADVRNFEDGILTRVSTIILVMKEYERPPRRIYNNFKYHISDRVADRLKTRGFGLVESEYANKGKNRLMVFTR